MTDAIIEAARKLYGVEIGPHEIGWMKHHIRRRSPFTVPLYSFPDTRDEAVAVRIYGRWVGIVVDCQSLITTVLPARLLNPYKGLLRQQSATIRHLPRGPSRSLKRT